MPAQAEILEKQSKLVRENFKVNQIRVDTFESELHKTVLASSNCCNQMPTTTIHENTKISLNYDWTVIRKFTGHTLSVDSLAISKEGLLISCSRY